jgi:hypothetical protein
MGIQASTQEMRERINFGFDFCGEEANQLFSKMLQVEDYDHYTRRSIGTSIHIVSP